MIAGAMTKQIISKISKYLTSLQNPYPCHHSLFSTKVFVLCLVFIFELCRLWKPWMLTLAILWPWRKMAHWWTSALVGRVQLPKPPNPSCLCVCSLTSHSTRIPSWHASTGIDVSLTKFMFKRKKLVSLFLSTLSKIRIEFYAVGLGVFRRSKSSLSTKMDFFRSPKCRSTPFCFESRYTMPLLCLSRVRLPPPLVLL